MSRQPLAGGSTPIRSVVDFVVGPVDAGPHGQAATAMLATWHAAGATQQQTWATAYDDALTKAMPSRQGIVELTLTRGKKLRQHVKAVRGTSDNPMTRAEVDEKGFHLLKPILGAKRARLLCDTVWTLEDVSSMRNLRPLLRV